MKIITVNIPVPYIEAIAGLVGENGLYPSRSELVRVAIRDWFKKELNREKEFEKFHNEEMLVQKEQEPGLVTVPGDKTYKIIQK